MGVLAVTVGAARLTSDDRPVRPAGQSGEAVAAMWPAWRGRCAVAALITGAAALSAPAIV